MVRTASRSLVLIAATLAGPACGDDGAAGESESSTGDDTGSPTTTAPPTTTTTSMSTGAESTGEMSSSSEDGSSSAESSTSDGPPSTCGDAVVDEGEACDDGNDVDSDGCNTDCVESGALLWEHVYVGPEGGSEVIDVAFGSDGRLHAIGATAGAVENDNDIVVYALSPDGRMLWDWVHDSDGDVESLGGSTDRGHGIAVEPDGEIVVAGYELLVDESVWVGKLDADGNELWAHSDPMETGRAYDVTVDDADGVFLVGSFGLTSFVRMLNTNGVEYWTEEREGTGGCNGCDAFNAVTAVPGGLVAGGRIDNDDYDTWIGAFDLDGNELWADTAVDVAPDMVIDIVRAGDVTLAVVWTDFMTTELRAYDDEGGVSWTLPDPFGDATYGRLAAAPDGGYATAVGGYDVDTMLTTVTVARYDAESAPLWTRAIELPEGVYAEPRGLAVGADGRVAVGGMIADADSADGWCAVLAP